MIAALQYVDNVDPFGKGRSVFTAIQVCNYLFWSLVWILLAMQRDLLLRRRMMLRTYTRRRRLMPMMWVAAQLSWSLKLVKYHGCNVAVAHWALLQDDGEDAEGEDVDDDEDDAGDEGETFEEEGEVQNRALCKLSFHNLRAMTSDYACAGRWSRRCSSTGIYCMQQLMHHFPQLVTKSAIISATKPLSSPLLLSELLILLLWPVAFHKPSMHPEPSRHLQMVKIRTLQSHASDRVGALAMKKMMRMMMTKMGKRRKKLMSLKKRMMRTRKRYALMLAVAARVHQKHGKPVLNHDVTVISCHAHVW